MNGLSSATLTNPYSVNRLRQRVGESPKPPSQPPQTDGSGELSGKLGLSLQGIRDLLRRYVKPAPAAQTTTAAVPAPAKSRYTVRTGDTLWKIAASTLGNGNRWREIYDLNRKAIGSDPNRITPGEVLDLPGGGTKDTRKNPKTKQPAKPAAPPKKPTQQPKSPSKLPESRSYFISQYRSDFNSREDAPHNGNCGPTSLTMVARAFKAISVSPKSADEAIEETRKRMGAGKDEYSGTSYAQLVKGAKSYGLDAKVIYGKIAAIEEELKKGRLVIAHVIPNYLNPDTKSTGHYTVVTGIHDGKVYLNDPAHSAGPVVISEKAFLKGQKARGTYGLVSIGS